jgi:tetratricopeptide (TPR) repeat protein
MYGAYFNLGPALSPCLYAAIPLHAYEFAQRGEQPRIDLQRIMPPAFRTNLIRESGLHAFGIDHPDQLPEELRTPRWQQLCDWVAAYRQADLARQRLTCHVLFRLGFRRLVLELIEERPTDSLQEPGEFHLQRLRDFAQYADSVGGRAPTAPRVVFETLDNPRCPLILRYSGSVFAVVYAARVTRSVEDAVRGRARARDYLDEILADDDFSEFEKTMLHSRFYRGVGFVPFMQGDRAGTVEDMARAEELARALDPATPWEELLARENLHACLESRSKEAFGLGQTQLGQARTEEFLALDPHDPKSHIELGESLSKQERFAEAADSYLRAARLGPLGTALAYNMAGECFDQAGQPALAEDCFAQALRFDPHAISAARGWRRVAANGMTKLAGEYADQLEAWGAARSAER